MSWDMNPVNTILSLACLKQPLGIFILVIRIANNQELAIEIGRPEGPAQVVKPFFRNEPTYRNDLYCSCQHHTLARTSLLRNAADFAVLMWGRASSE